MGIKIKNKILDDFNKSYDCKLTAEDIIAKTDYFNTSPQTSQKVNPLFKVRYSYAFMYALIIFLSLSVCGLFGYNQYIKRVDYCLKTVEVEPTLTDEEINYFREKSLKFVDNEVVKIKINKSEYIYIYSALDKNDVTKTIYFYKLLKVNNDLFSYVIKSDDYENIVDNDNKVGILCVLSNTNSYQDKLFFKISNDYVSYDYSIIISK